MTWPSLLVMLVMLISSVASIVALSGIRAYLGHYAAWVAAERDIAAYMSSYALAPTPSRRRAVEDALTVMQADHQALQALGRPHIDYARLKDFLKAGRSARTDVSGMVLLIRAAQLTGGLAGPLQLCDRLDRLAASYDALWHVMLAGGSGAPPSAAQRSGWFGAVHGLHHRVIPLERRLATSINGEAQGLGTMLLIMVIVSFAAMIVACYWVTHRIVAATATMASALRIERERAGLLLSSISDAVVSTDQRGVVQFLNGAAERLLGWSLADAQGRAVDEIVHLETIEGERLDLRGALGQVLSEGTSSQLSGQREQLVARDGSVTPVSERITPVRGSDGSALGAVLVMRNVTPERRLSEQLRHQALHDALTGLANRAHFEQVLAASLEQSHRDGASYAAMFVDLDQFKVVNDTCGHHAGDELIRLASVAVCRAVQATDLVARLGGDEFGIVLRHRGVQETLGVAEAIRQALEELHFVQNGQGFRVTGSIGVVHDDPSLRTVTEVLGAADRACYAAKEAGRNQVRLYRATDQTIDNQHGEMKWVARLNLALDEERLELHAQEIRPLQAGPGQSPYELLLRLRDERGRLVLPGAFIPAAERFGLMKRVDRWVIEQACIEQGRRLRVGEPTPLCMINLSRSSVDNPEIVEFVAGCLQENEVGRGCIGFELTETAAIGNLKAALGVMQQLRQLGCPLALDDFGSGMSSYRYLRELPVDIVKIDGSFVRNVNTDPVAYAMIQAIHNVARAAGLCTIAECVEDQATLETLTRLRIDFAQGRAVAREQFWLAGRGVDALAAASA